jgi:hypothetical protein
LAARTNRPEPGNHLMRSTSVVSEVRYPTFKKMMQHLQFQILYRFYLI